MLNKCELRFRRWPKLCSIQKQYALYIQVMSASSISNGKVSPEAGSLKLVMLKPVGVSPISCLGMEQNNFSSVDLDLMLTVT